MSEKMVKTNQHKETTHTNKQANKQTNEQTKKTNT